MKIIIKLILLLGLTFASNAYSSTSAWKAYCQEDELTGDVTGSVTYFAPGSIDFLLSFNLYGYPLDYGVTLLAGHRSRKLKPQRHEFGWYYLADTLFLPSKDRGSVYFRSDDIDGIFGLRHSLSPSSELPKWFTQRLFSEEILRIRFSYYDNSGTIYDIPLAGLEERMEELISQCRGKARPTPYVKRFLPRNLKRLLK